MFPLSPDREYHPEQLSKWFDLSRTTLFRMETRGKVSSVQRDTRAVRSYSSQQVLEIAQLVTDNLRARLNNNLQYDHEFVPPDLTELLYRIKVVQNPEEGLSQMRQLAKGSSLSEKTSALLMGAARQLPAGHKYRIAVWQIMTDSEIAARKIRERQLGK
jgi:hypothetical protein